MCFLEANDGQQSIGTSYESGASAVRRVFRIFAFEKSACPPKSAKCGESARIKLFFE